MRLLIITQKVDRRDPILGFFHDWIKEFAKKLEGVTVICLEKGEQDLPSNVEVLSLGKEDGKSRSEYFKRFYKYIWAERRQYDAVFVHMNEEYVLLGGFFWWIMGKKILLWRNHVQGTWKTPLAAFFADVVFYTSPYSFTARYRKAKRVSAGINLEKFDYKNEPERAPHSILSLGRIAPIKNINLLVEALIKLDLEEESFVADIIGDAEESDKKYYETLKSRAIKLVEIGKVQFKPAVPNPDTAREYQTHEIFVNLTNSGSLDKTILSAMVSGAIVVLCNKTFTDILPPELIFRENDTDDLMAKLKYALHLTGEEKVALTSRLKNYVDENHSLRATIESVIKVL